MFTVRTKGNFIALRYCTIIFEWEIYIIECNLLSTYPLISIFNIPSCRFKGNNFICQYKTEMSFLLFRSVYRSNLSRSIFWKELLVRILFDYLML